VTVVLVTGKTGQVGRELVRLLTPLARVIATGREQMNLAEPDSIRKAMREFSPDIVVNAAAYTAVDKAESEPELAMRVNGVAPGVLAEEAKRMNALLVHYSTDYIFDGLRGKPYVEDDAPNPVNAYGKTKLEGERAIAAVGGAFLVLRTSWIYSDQPPNFVLTMLKLARQKSELAVVNDQIGSPTWARTLATATADVLRQGTRARDEPGVYHLSARDYTTRFLFAKRILELAQEIAPGSTGMTVIRPVSTTEYPLPAQRPLNAATSKEKIRRIFGIEMSPWGTQLKAHLIELLRGDTRAKFRAEYHSP
jgi:dTDP-4-dehydrorhamnose reductase